MADAKERPILFSGPMVRAILDGRKTQTRRIMRKIGPINGQRFRDVDDLTKALTPGFDWMFRANGGTWNEVTNEELLGTCPYGVPGDRLWVRETWADTNGECGPMISYRAGGDRFLVQDGYPMDYSRYTGCTFTMWCGDLRRGEPGHSWRPSIHMPRWASRILLEVTSVRVERLQDISEEDARAEGVTLRGMTRYDGEARAEFAGLWDSINAKRGFAWDANPWVWVIESRRIENA